MKILSSLFGSKQKQEVKKIALMISEFISDFGGRAIASYRHHLNEANAQARAEAQQRWVAGLAENMYPVYNLYGEIMMEAINNTTDITHIQPVEYLHQITSKNWLQKSDKGLWHFQYRARYLRGFGQTRTDLNRILQNELDELTYFRGVDRIVVYTRLENDGKLIIKVAFFTDVMKIREKEIEKELQ